jgi:hypothetical protein
MSQVDRESRRVVCGVRSRGQSTTHGAALQRGRERVAGVDAAKEDAGEAVAEPLRYVPDCGRQSCGEVVDGETEVDQLRGDLWGGRRGASVFELLDSPVTQAKNWLVERTCSTCAQPRPQQPKSSSLQTELGGVKYGRRRNERSH